MPAYTYYCDGCETDFEAIAERTECTIAQPCPMCEIKAERQFGRIGFILKGDGWVGKNQRLKNQMKDKNSRLSRKSREKSKDANVRLRPNVAGEETDTWTDAKKLARSKGKDTTSYEGYVRKERSGK